MNDRFRALHDRDGDLGVLSSSGFDLSMYSSALHHIPDYLTHLSEAAADHPKPRRSLVSIQDPLWYSRVPRTIRLLTQVFISLDASARVTPCEASRPAPSGCSLGSARRTRSSITWSGTESMSGPCDRMQENFESVELRKYWSSQRALQQKLGERLGLVDTIAIFASGYRGHG